jgi:hypothetical protein
MALVDIYNCWAAQSGTLRAKFIAACLKASYDILNEDAGTENHANRVTWANSIINGTVAAVEEKASQHLRYAMASNATLQSACEAATDNDVIFIVNSQINTFATG